MGNADITLTARERQVLQLAADPSLKIADIATILGIKPTTVLSRFACICDKLNGSPVGGRREKVLELAEQTGVLAQVLSEPDVRTL
jgi:DNA-binding NarL/FixJ family response regulator